MSVSQGSFLGFLHPRGCTCINLDPFLSLRDNSCSILRICIGTNLIWINILNLELLSNHIVLNLSDCIRWLWSILCTFLGWGTCLVFWSLSLAFLCCLATRVVFSISVKLIGLFEQSLRYDRLNLCVTLFALVLTRDVQLESQNCFPISRVI